MEVAWIYRVAGIDAKIKRREIFFVYRVSILDEDRCTMFACPSTFVIVLMG
jgi:hypothetical protein